MFTSNLSTPNNESINFFVLYLMLQFMPKTVFFF